MFNVKLQNPVKLDVTYSEDGTCVQWNGEEWLAYDSKAATEYREKCLIEFKNKFNRDLK